jgi:hypothetical protein
MSTTFCPKSRTILFDYPVSTLLGDALSPSQRHEGPSATPTNPAEPACILGRCLHTRDPLGTSRVLVEYRDRWGDEYHLWLTPLLGLNIEQDDELLLVEPRGSREPIITGVVARRHAPRAAPTLAGRDSILPCEFAPA